jgi:hypothetical protein
VDWVDYRDCTTCRDESTDTGITPGIDCFGVLLSTRISISVESHLSIPQGFDLDHDCEDAAVILLTQRSWTEKDC